MHSLSSVGMASTLSSPDLQSRLDLLSEFLDPYMTPLTSSFKPGTLTILDLSDPMLERSLVNSLFTVCVDKFR